MANNEVAGREEVRNAVNAALHGDEKPCEFACTHTVVGEWTALGIANVIARSTHEPLRCLIDKDGDKWFEGDDGWWSRGRGGRITRERLDGLHGPLTEGEA